MRGPVLPRSVRSAVWKGRGLPCTNSDANRGRPPHRDARPARAARRADGDGTGANRDAISATRAGGSAPRAVEDAARSVASLSTGGTLVAAPGGLQSLIGGLGEKTKKALNELLIAWVPNSRFGPVAHQKKSENFQAYYVSSTTSSTADEEFSVLHGLGRAPYLIGPLVPVDSRGGRTVRLRVTRAADAQRVYLASPETSAQVTLLVE